MNCQVSTPTSCQASQRRRSKTNSRGPRRSLLTSDTIDELRLASELVRGHSEGTKSFDVASEAPTTAPPSKEPSPALSYCAKEPAEIEEVVLPPAEWPSLRESLNGWDFCSEASDDTEQDLAENHPETNWCILTEDSEHLSTAVLSPEAFAAANEGSSKTLQDASYADRLRACCEMHTRPPAGGIHMPELRAYPLRRRGCRASQFDENLEHGAYLETLSERRDSREHGWRKQHKASWSTKQQKKVAEAVARRNQNSFRSRGWLDEEEQC